MFSIFVQIMKDNKEIVQKDLSLKTSLWLTALLLLVTFFVYSPARYNTLTNWDDRNYIKENTAVTNPGKDIIKQYFAIPGGFAMGNYHPLTMLSYAWEYKSSQLNPKPYHIHNILLHLANVALVFLFVLLLTQKRLAALIAACFFALQPMHVESVAWVAERKDLLFVFFSLLSMICYIQYVKKNKAYFYLLAIALFVMALLGKAMAVSVALLLFLIDYYLKRNIPIKKIILEKIPFLIIAFVFGLIAIKAQHSIQAIETKDYSFYNRILFASYACFTYLVKAVVPYNLNCYYDYPPEGTYTYYIAYTLVLLALIFFIYKKFKDNRLIVFSALFFLVSISQVLQLLPVGGAIVAERYTYLPYVGLFLAPSVILADLYFSRKKNSQLIVYAVLAVSLFAYSYQTYKRCFVWKDTLTIWNDALSKKPDIVKGLNGRGDAYNEIKEYRLAIVDFDQAIRLNDTYTDAYYNRGIAEYFVGTQYQEAGNTQEAQTFYLKALEDNSKAIKYNPGLDRAYFNRAGNYFILGIYDKALEDALKAKSLGMDVDPRFIEALQAGLKK
jgi:tetratricopeptide (TPR) repeat protein